MDLIKFHLYLKKLQEEYLKLPEKDKWYFKTYMMECFTDEEEEEQPKEKSKQAS